MVGAIRILVSECVPNALQEVWPIETSPTPNAAKSVDQPR